MLTGKYDSVFTAKALGAPLGLKINPVGWNINNRPRRLRKEMNIMKKMEWLYISSKDSF